MLIVLRGPSHPGNNFAQLCAASPPPARLACPQGEPPVPGAGRSALPAPPVLPGLGLPPGRGVPPGRTSAACSTVPGSGGGWVGGCVCASGMCVCVCVSPPAPPSLGTHPPPSPAAVPPAPGAPCQPPSLPAPCPPSDRPPAPSGTGARLPSRGLPGVGGPADTTPPLPPRPRYRSPARRGLQNTRCRRQLGAGVPAPDRRHRPSPRPTCPLHRRVAPRRGDTRTGTTTYEFRAAESFLGAPPGPAPCPRSATRPRPYLCGGPGGGGGCRGGG